jgi:hypothetical protein
MRVEILKFCEVSSCDLRSTERACGRAKVKSVVCGVFAARRPSRVEGVEQINTALIIATAHKRRHISTNAASHASCTLWSICSDVNAQQQHQQSGWSSANMDTAG